MRRRTFLALLGGAAAAPFSARAQEIRIVGILNFQNPEPFRTLLQQALREHGYTEGRNLHIEFRSAEGDRGRLAGFAAELIRRKVDVVVAYPTPAVEVMKQATGVIPIVLVGAGDPVGTGLVGSLARPGGNITGTSSTTAELGPKTIEVIRDIIPSLRRVAVLANAADGFTKSFLEQVHGGGSKLGVEIRTIMIHTPSELESALVAVTQSAADAIMVQPSLPRRRIAELALQHRVPSIAPTNAFAAEGGLAAYAANQTEIIRKTAVYIDKILKGSKPAELPVEQPTQFSLVINLRTAKALGLEIPPMLIARADEVIE